MQTGSAGVDDGRIAVHAQGAIAFEVFGWNIGKERPPGMAVHAVADRPARNAAIADLHNKEEIVVLIVAAVQQVGAGAVAGRSRQFRALLAETAAHDIEQAGQGVGATAQRGGEFRMEEGAVRHAGVNQIVKTVVKQNLRVVDHDEVDADEHLEHARVEIEIDRPNGLRVGAGPVENRLVALTPDGEFHFERTVAESVIINIVFERLGLSRNIVPDEGLDGPVGPVQQCLAGGQIGIPPKALAQFLHALLSGFTAGHNPHEVRAVHQRNADIVQNQVQDGPVEFPFFKQFDGWNAESLTKD